MNLRSLKQLKARSMDELLREQSVKVANADSDQDALPVVRVTAGAHAFSGIPAKVEEVRGETWLVLVHDDDVTYLPLRSISALTVQNPRGEALPEPPSKLNLDREAREIEEAMKKSWGGKVSVQWPPDVSEEIRQTLVLVLKALQPALEGVVADKMGKEALADIKQIHLIPSNNARLGVEREGGALKITAGMAATVTSSELRSKIEQTL